jgi:hypothetical protein
LVDSKDRFIASIKLCTIYATCAKIRSRSRVRHLIFENLSEKHLSVIPNIKGFRPFPEVICPTRIRKAGFVKLNLCNNLTFWDGWKVFFSKFVKKRRTESLKASGLNGLPVPARLGTKLGQGHALPVFWLTVSPERVRI